MDKELINQLLESMITAYQKSVHDRRRLHKIEYDDVNIEYLLLGEVEILSDNIAGVASHCKRGQPKDVDWAINELDKNSIFKNDYIVKWIKESASEYQEYFSYLQTIELLRCALREYISTTSDSQKIKYI